MKNDINLTIEPRVKDIGIPVRRILPWAKKRMVGPFIFLDEMGPVFLHAPNDHIDVRPHPHIGLSTLTYLFEGSLYHRDSLGSEQEILPGEVNWMTAGKGIAHSERETASARSKDRSLHGLQFWVALPKSVEDMDPTFFHYDSNLIPKIETGAALIDVVAGTYAGQTSPLIAHSPMIFLIARANKEGMLHIPSNGHELAIYVVKGTATINGEKTSENKMVVFNTGSDLAIEHSADALIAVIGGEPFPEERYIYWNFVSSSKEKIEKAKRAWEDGSFPQVPGDAEKIPLPKD
ncbi:pirin family protein [Peredibacter sp. HCB2-198]|uniref:pirin family protein n=1 Tax=Peredibacter sp. HCB2-198 TaxID=3383025 RepID=UPI0038B43B03